MVQKTKDYIFQYKVLFYLSWICLYLIFPTWISLHTIVQAKGFSYLSNPFARSLVILGFIIYFAISAYLINRYFNALTVNKPVFININDWFKDIKSNSGLFIVCCLSLALHIYPLSLDFVITGGGETSYIHQPMRIYDSLNSYWYGLFDIPTPYVFWCILFLLIFITKQKKMINFTLNYISDRFTLYKSNYLIWVFVISSIFIFFSMYSNIFPYYSPGESLHLLRFPPVSKFIYLITYYAFDFSYMGPRVVQLIFYIMATVYLYRTIHLFCEKECALLGTSIYLFSPVVFSYSSRAALASGTVFFMILISFHFLRFIKNEEDRDLILTSFFIGIGFMYKRLVLVMLIICFAYLVFSRIKKREWHSFVHFKILLLSLIFVLPFLMIGRLGGLNFYEPELYNLISFDYLFRVIQSQLSFIISFLLLFSIAFSFFAKKDDLSLFYILYFSAFYVFFTLKIHPASQRYSMALYPAIAVLLAQLIFSMVQRVRYKHMFRLCYPILIGYLIFLCLVPRTSSSLVTFKYKDFESQYYPVDEATDWIKNKTGSEDKIAVLFMGDYWFYMDRIYADKNLIVRNRLFYLDNEKSKEIIYPLKKLKEFCYTEKISHIMFVFGPKNSAPDSGASQEVKYLKEKSDNEFTEVARFNLEDNYILIYKLAGSPAE